MITIKIKTPFNFNALFYDNYSNKALIHTSSEKFEETEVLLRKRFKCFPLTVRQKNWKRQKSSVILDLCLKENSGREIT